MVKKLFFYFLFLFLFLFLFFIFIFYFYFLFIFIFFYFFYFLFFWCEKVNVDTQKKLQLLNQLCWWKTPKLKWFVLLINTAWFTKVLILYYFKLKFKFFLKIFFFCFQNQENGDLFVFGKNEGGQLGLGYLNKLKKKLKIKKKIKKK